MSSMIWRVILAVIAFVVVWALLPLVARFLGFPLEGDLLQILKICIAALCVIYIVWGKGPTWTP